MYGFKFGSFLLTLLLPLFCLAEKTTIIADADEMTKDRTKQTLTLVGNVNVIFQQQHLLCDRATVYEDKSLIVAEGNVVLQNARTTLRGEKVEFNYDTNTGKLYNGVVTAGQVLIEAKEIEKVGENEYEADDAYYTACLTCPPSWGFTAANVKADIDGYAYINRPWLHLLQFPVLPLPYLVVPLNSQRQTGFLVPQPFTDSDSGLAIELPFYWAIDRSHDATFSVINYEKRGQQVTGNYRYMISDSSSGELSAAILRDRSLPTEQYRDRWFIEYAHHYDLPNNYTQRAKIERASDRFYAADFYRQFRHNGDPALESSVSLTKKMQSSLITAEASVYQSQIEPNFQFDNDPSLHRLPEINFEVLDQRLFDDYDVFFNMKAQYLNVARSGLAYEHARNDGTCSRTPVDENGNPTGGEPIVDAVCYPTALSNGQFQYNADLTGNYGDLVRTGQRLDIMPSVHAPFWVGRYLDVDPALSFRFTQYALGVESDSSQGYNAYPNRFYAQLDVSAKSDINKVYDWGESTKFKHSIIPQVNLKYIPTVNQTDHTFFGHPGSLRYFREIEPIDDSDADWRNFGRGIQFDNNDRIIGQQYVRFGLTNKIVSRDTSAEENFNATTSKYNYQQNLIFDVSQTFDIKDAQNGADARPWNDIRTTTQLNMGPFSQSLYTYYYPYHNRTRWVSDTRFYFLNDNYLAVSYYKHYKIEQRPPVDENFRQEFLTLGTGLNFPYVSFFGAMLYNFSANRGRNENPFQSWRVAASITPPGSCWIVSGQLVQTLGKPINYSVSMEFKFGE